MMLKSSPGLSWVAGPHPALSTLPARVPSSSRRGYRSGAGAPLLLALALGTALTSATGSAWAQKFVALENGAVTRDTKLRSTREKPYWINREDCLADDTLHFEMKVDGPTDDNLEVWVGDGDCTTRAQRLNDDAKCWQVLETSASNDSFTLDVRVRDVAAGRPAEGYAAKGTAADCQREWSSALTYYFMYVDDTDDHKVSIKWGGGDGGASNVPSTGVDLKGPNPPTNVRAGIADNSLRASWTTSDSGDLFGYRIYCARPGAVTPTVVPLLGDAAVGTGDGGLAGWMDAGGMDAGGLAGGMDAGGMGLLPSVPLDAGLGLAGDCAAPGMVPGELPGPELEVCGRTGSSTAREAYARGLQNGVATAIAVAAVDEVGNAGRLSNVACGTPERVYGFFTRYSAYGGGGGGGFCAAASHGGSRRGSTTLPLLGGLVLGALWVVRRGRLEKRRGTT